VATDFKGGVVLISAYSAVPSELKDEKYMKIGPFLRKVSQK